MEGVLTFSAALEKSLCLERLALFRGAPVMLIQHHRVFALVPPFSYNWVTHELAMLVLGVSMRMHTERKRAAR